MICHDCGETVELTRNEKNILYVACGCTEKPVRVESALPMGWSE